GCRLNRPGAGPDVVSYHTTTRTPVSAPGRLAPLGHVRHRGSGRCTLRGEAAMCDDSPTADLVLRARKGDSDAWDAIVERFAPLIWSICLRYSLRRADAEDVGQYVWLRLVDHLDPIPHPAPLPGWLVTTTPRGSSPGPS